MPSDGEIAQKIFDALPDDIKQKLNKMWGSNYKYDNVPKTAKGQGEWVGERGNSNYKFDVNRKPIDEQNDKRKEEFAAQVSQPTPTATVIAFKQPEKTSDDREFE